MLEPYLRDADCTLYCGDVLDVLRQLPDESVHMACTSPPFYGLRDYGTGAWEGGDEGCDHMKDGRGRRDHSGGEFHGTRGQQTGSGIGLTPYGDVCGKCGARRIDQQIGLEATPDLWVARLVEVFREVRRVLRPEGQLWVEIGDSYAGSWGAQSRENGTGADSLSARQIESHPKTTRTGAIPPGSPFKPKDMIGAPWLLAFALRADGWYLRSEIIWAKPNPMPESVTDRPTVSHSRVFLLAKQARYFYDVDAIREPAENRPQPRPEDKTISPNGNTPWLNNRYAPGESGYGHNPAGRNRRSVWTIPTQPYPEAHFATWPEKLVEPMILAGTSERGVCPECRAPWERITEASGGTIGTGRGWEQPAPMVKRAPPLADYQRTTTGWQPTCACYGGEPHGPTVPATVLDVFAGSGTTLHVARRLGRHSVGIELNPEYCELAARRLQQQSLLA